MNNPIRDGKILLVFLATIRDNPGLRPCELYKLLAQYNIGPHWLKHLKRREYVVDTGAVANKEAFQAYEVANPYPIDGSPEYVAWCRAWTAFNTGSCEYCGCKEQHLNKSEWYTAHPSPEGPGESSPEHIAAYDAWLAARPKLVPPSIMLTDRGLARINGPLPKVIRRRQQWDFFEEEKGRVDALITEYNEGRPWFQRVSYWWKGTQYEKNEDGTTVVEFRADAGFYEKLKVLEHELHGGGFSLED